MIWGSNHGGGEIFRTHPASFTWVPCLQRVKLQGHGVGNPPPSRAEVTETVDLYLYSTSGPLWPVIG
jgi:hypothetical protein